MTKTYDVILIGGGAAGFFAGINIAEKNPDWSIAILERGKEVLTKVKISGGGRCNVTHACFVPNELTQFYPRGQKELRGPFHQFCSGDTIEWFEQRGVPLKIEEDGRMFPESNSSETIINCFLAQAKKNNIEILKQQTVKGLSQKDNIWHIQTQNENYTTHKVVLTTGSNANVWELMAALGHTIIPPVPSLFTLNTKDPFIKDLAGISMPVSVSVNGLKLSTQGPLLITHWGFSGPAILKLSAWGARLLAEKNYQFTIRINWLNQNSEDVLEQIAQHKSDYPKKNILNQKPFDIPNRLWERFVLTGSINPAKKWADLSKNESNALASLLASQEIEITSKSTFKDEFVTAGGIDLKEVNFKTMESKICPNLYFAGETLNIDAVTGGFNFQNAWTTGYILSQNI
ncbi:MAG: NAD(P)/FAD-dependent oxidoreductase [Flavobacteriales bacterium]|nr:NAD(P)/FAD-dependent oxidoreductase [Flavobacteriales bacterium]